jgi:hypothetical protein
MKFMKLRDLPDWPPAAGGAFTGGDRFAVYAEQVVIKDVQEVVKDRVSFSGVFDGRIVSYNYIAPNEKLAGKVAEALRASLGKSLLAVGDVDIAAE